MVVELMEGYLPQHLLFRENQINKINLVFEQFKEFKTASNLILTGGTGGGKTAVIKRVSREKDSYLYVSAQNIKRSIILMQKIANNKSNLSNELLEKTIQNLKFNPKILIIDELNRMQDLDSFFDFLNFLYRETAIPIILVTNNLRFTEYMPEDARLTLFFEKVFFEPYDPNQLYEIAKDRLNEMNNKFEGIITEAGLREICAHASKSSSARTMFGLIRRCIIARDFSSKTISHFIKQDEREELHRFIMGLTQPEREFLTAFLDIYEKNTLKDKPIRANDFYSVLPHYTPSRISQFITTLEKDYALITTESHSLGRGGGRYRSLFMEPNIYAQLIGVLPC